MSPSTFLSQKFYLISPQPVFVITCKTVDNNWNWQCEDEDTTEGTKSSDQFAGKCRRRKFPVTENIKS